MTRRRAALVAVLPLDYLVESFPQDVPDAALDDPDVDDHTATCTFSVHNLNEHRRPDRDVFSLTVPARQSLRDALPLLAGAGAPRRVEQGVEVFAGRLGERTSYRVRGGSGTYDVVALQADHLRLTWLAPVGRTPTMEGAGRRLWRDVQDSLAVRAPAAADGDPDADSDDVAPEEATDAPRDLEPASAAPVLGFGQVSCAPRGPDGVVVTFQAPERLAQGRHCWLSRQQRLAPEPERVTVSTDLDGPLRDTFEEVSRFKAEGGDDSTSDIEYDRDVTGPGGVRGESLVWSTFNDGSPRDIHVVQAGGVRISWSVEPGAWGPQGAELELLVASLGVSRP